MDASRLHVSPGTDRTPGRPRRRLLTVACASLAALATLVVATAAPASAATVNGIATIASPGTTTALTAGASTTPFTVSLPTLAACSGDTATGGYHVYSYLVPQGTDLAPITFVNSPSTGYGFVDNLGTYYGPVNTAIGTGQIINIPNNFEWGPLVSADSVALSTLLYTGSGASATGIWEAGLVCANTSGAVVDNWNTEVTFAANAGDPNGFHWTAVPGPSGSVPAAFTSASSTSFNQGVAGTFTPTASGNPAPVITESGALPTGVTFSGGVLSGTPSVTGTFPISFTATNGIEAPATQPFTLTVGALPTVTSILPTDGPLAGGTSVVITGTDLTSATAVDFGANAAAITSNTATSITATSPAGSAGIVDVTVTTAGGTSATSSKDKFTYVAAPTVTSILPISGSAAGGTHVVITGTNLSSATAVDFGSNSATVTANSATSITATSPAGSAGTVDVSVTTAGGTSATSGGDQFTYVVAPVVTSILPTSGSGSGGTSVVITGTGLSSATAVHFGTNTAAITVDTATSITVTSPAGSGVVDVTVTTAGGTSASSANDKFTYLAAPAFTSAASATFTVGTVGTFTPAATGSPAPTITESGTLPTGVTFASGTLSGTPSHAGVFPITLTAHNGVGTDAVQAFTLTVVSPPVTLTAPIVGMASDPHGTGYWLADSAGDVAPFGGVGSYGSLAGVHLNAPVVHIVATSDGLGYWLVASDGGIFAFGAPFYGSTGNITLNEPVNGMAVTPDGNGYWMVASDGGLFAFGDAGFHGSAAGIPGATPVVGMATDTATGGYWLVSQAGGVYAFGAPFYGAA